MKTFLAQNQFNSDVHVPEASGTAAAPLLPPSPVAAVTISNPAAKATEGKAGTAGVNGPVRRSTTGTGLRVGEASADLPATSEIWTRQAGRDRHSISEPPSNEGRLQETPTAAHTKNPDVGALGTEFIHEIFFYARKLMTNYPGFVLDEARFLADIDEEPLFLRADGYLQRREA